MRFCSVGSTSAHRYPLPSAPHTIHANICNSMGQERSLQRRLAHQPRPLLSRFSPRPPPRLVRDPAEPRSVRRIPPDPRRRRARHWSKRAHHILCHYARATRSWREKLRHRGGGESAFEWPISRTATKRCAEPEQAKEGSYSCEWQCAPGRGRECECECTCRAAAVVCGCYQGRS